MDGILDIINWLLPLLYLGLVIDYGTTFILRVRTAARNPWLPLVIIVHAAYLMLYGWHFGWHLLAAPHIIPSVLALSMAALHAIIERATRDRRTGVFVITLVFLLQYSMALSAAGFKQVAVAPTSAAWSRLHLLPAIFAYTALAFAGVYGLLYVLVARGLKKHRFGLLFDRLPPLEMLGKMTWYAMVTGFIFLTMAMASAPLMVRAAGDSRTAASLHDAKVLAKIIVGAVAWMIYAAAIGGRLLRRWPLARIVAVAVVASAIVMVLLVASGLLS